MDIRNFHQSPEEIIKAATPEQRILWNHLFLLCGERLSISQLYYQGAAAGTDFVTYRARRLFFALEIRVSTGTYAAGANTLTIYDENNAIDFMAQNNVILWDTTAAAVRYFGNDILIKNTYFSRVVVGGYASTKFIGYRLTY